MPVASAKPEELIRSEGGKKTKLNKATVKRHQVKIAAMRSEIGKVVIGQKDTVEAVLTALFGDSNTLLEGVPGIAKSLLVETLARTISGATFKRIQFVPDLLPADITGVNAYNPKTGEFYIIKGPIFANFILADEINRAPPKTQAAMLEVMQERKVSIAGNDFRMKEPFLVIATQNPLEQRGVYPLPEALVDRFMLKILVYYPDREEEYQIIDRNTLVGHESTFDPVKPIISDLDILQIQEDIRLVHVSDEVKEYITDIVMTSRGKEEANLKLLKYVKYGGSPRASIFLAHAARVTALFAGRTYATPDDVKKMAYEVLRHRILLNYAGKAERLSTDDVVTEILDSVGAF
ncbi:MoxR family ATPase [archaeon]|nr:MoxR family ATPase [archaeon]